MLVRAVPTSREASICVRTMTVLLATPAPVQTFDVKDFTEMSSSFPLETLKVLP